MRFYTFILAIMLFSIFACGEDQGTHKSHNQLKSDKTEFEINISNGVLSEGEQKLVVTKDDNVRLIINSDKDLVMHVHGYDIEKNVKANQETYLDFHAHATGRFLVNTHELSDEVHGHHHSSHERHSIDPQEHGEIFMTTISSGMSFSLVIDDDFEGLTIPYHDHMNHNVVGQIIVSSESDFAETSSLIQIDSETNVFDPLEVVVASGATVTWELVKGKDVVLSSGLPPQDHDENHDDKSHSSTEESENLLMTIEVHPK